MDAFYPLRVPPNLVGCDLRWTWSVRLCGRGDLIGERRGDPERPHAAVR